MLLEKHITNYSGKMSKWRNTPETQYTILIVKFRNKQNEAQYDDKQREI
jgi:hypothetical protein